MNRLIPIALFMVVIASLFALAPSEAPACAVAPMRGERVEIAEETALIIWDAATKTEHFIRQAKFQSTSSDFGFLVPTPTEPKVAESDEAAYQKLAAITAPKHEYRTVKMPRPRPSKNEPTEMAMSRAGGANARPPSGVEVLQHSQVGDLEFVVLKFHRDKAEDPAEGAREVANWLKERRYEFGPQIAAWLKPYIANDWIMTAFRIAKPTQVSAGPATKTERNAVHEMKGKPIRMSFTTDKPFYPYREPVMEKPADGKPPMTSWRFLRVYMISSERFTGTLGKGATPWVGQAVHSEKMSEEEAKTAAAAAKLPGPLPANAWLTEFEDRSTPRQGTDEVYFEPSTDKDSFRRPPIIHDVIEYYDAPEPEHETPYAIKFFAIIGGIFFALVLGVCLYLIFRQR